MNRKSISEKSGRNKASRWILIPFGAIFFGAGLFMIWFMAIHPLLRWQGAKQWASTDCQILESRIEVDSDDDGTSYTPIVKFTYEVAGEQYSSDKVDFKINGGHGRAKRITQKYRVGKNAECFYNSNGPDDAVLEGIGRSVGGCYSHCPLC